MAKRPPQPTIRTAHMAAPLGGLNTVSPASVMPESDCAVAWNLIPGELGLEARPGYAEWCTGLTGTLTSEVRSILPFSGSLETKDRLFATTSSGIWGVSSSTGSPTLLMAFATTSNDAGYGVAKAVVIAAGHFLLYCDEENGLYVYTESTDAWTKVAMGAAGTEISGVDPASFVNVAVFKNRVWFTAKNSTKAWYLAASSIYGAATAFDFGAQFRAGGTLVGLWNWTYDGGAGIDDSLVALSSGGDVAIYQGTDPASATTFGLKGVWYVGDTLKGRRVVTDFGGDVLILSRLGLVPLSRLVVGTETTDASLYATAKINNLFVGTAAAYGGLHGWSVQVHPTANCLLVTLPYDGAQIRQLALSSSAKGWWPWRGLPILSAATWNGELYFGTRDGKVCRNTGYVDNLSRTSSSSYSAVAWSILPAFQNLGRPTQKQLQTIRPTILGGIANASVSATAKYNYDFTEPSAPSGNGGGGAGAWDSGVWDSATWQPDFVATQPILGASGMGREVSVALRGNAIAPTTLVGVDLYYTEGGPL